MAKSKEKNDKILFERTKPHCNIGTIGHVDHGKTTLTSAITKVLDGIGITKYRDYNQIDSNPEERDRKITIAAAHVDYETEKRHYSHIDCPGHQDYIKNMIVGASQLDGVILVVSALDGVQVQTKEHVILAKEIGLKYLIVFLNKVDALKDDKSMLELIEMEILELLETYGYEDVPVVHGSALQALNNEEIYVNSVKKLMETVDNYVEIPNRDMESDFLMPIESMLIVPGRGTVLTGKIERGMLTVGADLELVGPTRNRVTCMGMEMHRRVIEKALPGDSIGALLKGVGKKDIKKPKSFVLATPNSVNCHKSFKAHVYILKGEEGGRKTPFGSKYKPQIFFRMLNITGTVELEEGLDLVSPGDDVNLYIHLIEGVVLEKGLRFIIREGNITVGAGLITEII